MNLPTALRYLDTHTNLEATAGRAEGLSLERMARLVHVLGDPQRAYPVIHITGTNGKGSVARMVTRLLQAQGLSVGTYSSPHMEQINERIQWDAAPIGDDDLGEAIGAIAAIEEMSGVVPSYFEILTAAAFRWFAEVAVDVAVVEVGMLGRWDATNVADATVALCTNVGRDHTDGADGWRQAIATEKAGIVKADVTEVLVLGETDPVLQSVFAAAGAIETWRRDVDFGAAADRVAVGGRLVDIRTPGALHEEVYVPVHGAHQADNAAVAVAAAEAFLGRPQAEEVVEEAFAELTLPGRFEVVGRHPTVVVDAAHNPEGAAATAATLAEDMTLPGSVLMVVGLLAGRDPVELLAALGAADAGLLVVCAPASPRAMPTAKVAAAAERLGAVVEVVPDPVEALRRALAVATEDDLVLIAGSLYVAGPVRAALREMEVSA
ncbi:MAG: bifunctional folylpolyglutamate synthase/dihydrofolate synthase [Iamia sp.]